MNHSYNPAPLAEELLQPNTQQILKTKARAETVRQFLALVQTQFIVQVAAECLIVVMAWNYANRLHLIVWLALFIGVHNALELWGSLYTKRHGVPIHQVNRWVYFTHCIAGFNTLFWCYAYYAFAFGFPREHLFLIMMIGFMFLMGHYSRDDIKFACSLVLPMYLTIAGLHFHRGSESDYVIVAMVTLFFCGSFFLMVQQSKRSFDALYARYVSEELACALQDKNKELMLAKHQVETASQAKSRFFTAASHDLRQPLQVLSLLQGSLQLNVKQENVQSTLRQMEKALESLGSFFEDVLNVSKLESGQIPVTIEAVPLLSLFEKLEAEFKPLSDAKGLQLRFRGPHCALLTDKVLFERILRNLISNAIKYTEHGGILVACRAPAQQGIARIQVFDTGSGISADELPYIFEDFYQCRSPASHPLKQSEGIGLGLGIVKRMSLLLNHATDVRSQVNRGTVFSLRLPYSEMAEFDAAPAIKKDLGLSLAGQLILVVDDDASVVSAVKTLLQDWNAEVVTATTREALTQVVETLATAPKFLLVDFQFAPLFNGLDSIQCIRARFGMDIPAAIMTGNVSLVPTSVRSEKDIHVFPKPINPAKLRALLHFHLCLPASA